MMDGQISPEQALGLIFIGLAVLTAGDVLGRWAARYVADCREWFAARGGVLGRGPWGRP